MSDVNVETPLQEAQGESTTPSGPQTVGEIKITVTDQSINYESAFSVPEVVFWIDVVKQMIVNKVVEQGQ